MIEQHILAPRYDWPLVPLAQHRCLQATALAHPLPASLAGAAAALGLDQQKDTAGRRLMLLMSRPRRPRPDENPAGTYWYDDPERLARLYEYCRRDVEVERALHQRLGFLDPAEQAIWQLDAAINARGLPIDRDLLDGALRIAEARRKSCSVCQCEDSAFHQKARLSCHDEFKG